MPLIFRSLIMIFWVGISFSKSYLGLLHLLNLFMSFAKFINLSAIIIFSTTSFSSPAGIPMTWTSDLLPLFHRSSESCLIFSHNLLLFRLGNFYWPIFNFTDSFLCPLHSAIEAIQWLVYFGYLIGSSLYHLFLCREFHFSI